ncbi:MAG: DUF5106 domain-containing protein [Flavobacteriales bacterium]|nr:DUF5106 domain-containing protein [Flavobacteriales bacterium]
MKKMLLLAGIVLGFSIAGNAQNPTLKFKVKGVKDTDVHLAYYFGNKLFYSDTARADKDGNFVFGTKKTYEPGVYAVVLPGTKFFEIVLNNENVVMSTDTTDMYGHMVVTKSKENQLFYDYIHFINERRKESEPLREKMKTADPKSKEYEDLKNQLNALDKKVKEKQATLFNDNPTSLTAKVIRMSVDVEIPEAPKNADGSPKDSLFAYKFAKAHYWDHVDFKDPSLVRCTFFHNKLENYFKNMVVQDPDSMIAESDRLIGQMLDNKDMFKYTVHYLTYTFESSKIMCMDAAFVHLAYKYYKTGKAFWLEEDKVKKIVERAEELSPILCGVVAHPLSLPDSNMVWRRLPDVKADFTLLIFWDPECGHCKKEMPKFAELYKRLKGQGLEIYSVSSDHNEKWKKFIRDNDMQFINVAVPEKVYSDQDMAREWITTGKTDLKSLNYRTTFDIYSTPKVFLLDKDKRIIAKQIEAEQAEKLFEFHMKKLGKTVNLNKTEEKPKEEAPKKEEKKNPEPAKDKTKKEPKQKQSK